MKKSIEWLIISTGITFLLVLFMDFTLFFFLALWSWVVAIVYAIKTRQEVDCRCFEEVKE